MKFSSKLIVAAAVASSLAGCAGMKNKSERGFQQEVNEAMSAGEQAVDPRGEARTGSRVHAIPYVDRSPVPYTGDAPADVSLAVQGASVADVIRGLVQPLDMTVQFNAGADPSREINLELNGVSRQDAIALAAQAAGYTVIRKPRQRTLIVSEVATHLYRLPPHLFSGPQSSYSISSTPSNSGGGMGGSMDYGHGGMGDASGIGGGVGGAGSVLGGESFSSGMGAGATTANFNLTGLAGPEDRDAFLETLQVLAGEEAHVTANWSTGMLSVRTRANGLHRVDEFIKQTVRDALTQVAIRVAVVDVQSAEGLQYGLDWEKLLSSGDNINLGLSGASAVQDAVITATYGADLDGTVTNASVSAVLRALKSNTMASVLTRPSVVTHNRTPAVLFSGQQIPYLGSIGSTTTGVSGTTSTNAAISYASDGIGIGVAPSVLDGKTVSVSFMPVLSSSGELRTFTTSEGELQAPPVTVQQSYFNVTLTHGQTIILGGNRVADGSETQNGVPGIADIPLLGKLFGSYQKQREDQQIIFLMSANILPPPQYDPIVEITL